MDTATRVKRACLWAALAGLLVAGLACSRGGPASPDRPSATLPIPRGADLVEARVIEVLDGATIDVEIEGRITRVRYLGVDVSETSGPGGEGRPIHEEALQFNRFLVDGKMMELERGAVEADAAGKLLRYVYVDGQMANTALLTNGYATVASFPPNFLYKSDFVAAQENAKSNRRGLWVSASEVTGDDAPIAHQTDPPPNKSFGTLPAPPGGQRSSQVCDYSDTTAAVIKANVDEKTGERLYHVPGGLFYNTTVVEAAAGDRWFCSEFEAIAAGWKKSKR